MINTERKIGINIFTLMKKNEINREELAKKLNYSYRDMCRILEGKLLLSSDEIKKIAEFFGKTKHELIYYEEEKTLPELKYMEEFDNMANLNKILDLLDKYIDLKEAI